MTDAYDTSRTPGDDDTFARSVLTAVLVDEPPLRDTMDDIEAAGRRLSRRRRAERRAGLGAGLLVAAGTVTWVAVGPLSPGRPPASVAVGPSSPAASSVSPSSVPPSSVPPSSVPPSSVPPSSEPPSSGDPAGTMLPVGYPLGEAFAAFASALPAGVSLGEPPMDVAWGPGGTLVVPVVSGGRTGTSTLTLGTPCTATAVAGVLDARTATAAADAVCSSWAAFGSPDVNAPVPTPTGPIDPAS